MYFETTTTRKKKKKDASPLIFNRKYVYENQKYEIPAIMLYQLLHTQKA